MFDGDGVPDPGGMPGRPIFISHPHVQFLYDEYNRCHNDVKLFPNMKKGDSVVIKACFIQFAPYAVWDHVEGIVVEPYKENVKVYVDIINYKGETVIQKWMIAEHIKRSKPIEKATKPLGGIQLPNIFEETLDKIIKPKRIRGRPRKDNGSKDIPGRE